MGNKFEEMNYLVDKLKEKREKELKKLNQKFYNEFIKTVEVFYDFNKPQDMVIDKITYFGRDISYFSERRYYDDVSKYERQKNYTIYDVDVCLFLELKFIPKIFSDLPEQVKKTETRTIRIDKAEECIDWEDIKFKLLEEYGLGYGVGYDNKKYKLRNIQLTPRSKSNVHKKPRKTIYYFTKEEKSLLSELEKDIYNKYKGLIESVKMSYIPKELWNELI